jgi:hypothetical protein
MACSAVELAVVLAVLATVLSSWRVLYSNSGDFEGEGVVVGRGVFRRARGSRWRWSVRGYSGRRGGVPSPRAQQRRSCCSSARRGAAGTGAAAQDPQWRGWRSAGLTSWFDPADSREKGSRVQPAPLRGRGALAVQEWAAQCHGADTGHTAQLPAVAGMGSP